MRAIGAFFVRFACVAIILSFALSGSNVHYAHAQDDLVKFATDENGTSWYLQRDRTERLARGIIVVYLASMDRYGEAKFHSFRINCIRGTYSATYSSADEYPLTRSPLLLALASELCDSSGSDSKPPRTGGASVDLTVKRVEDSALVGVDAEGTTWEFSFDPTLIRVNDTAGGPLEVSDLSVGSRCKVTYIKDGFGDKRATRIEAIASPSDD